MRFYGDTFLKLPSIDDNSYDLIIADPPYNLGNEEKEFLQKEFSRISKRGFIVFSPPENQWILPAEQYLFWVKSISTKNTSKRYSRFVEMIFLYGELKWGAGRHWSQYTNIFTDLVDSSGLHPHRKPPSLIERLILNHSDPGDSILDPFAGSFVIEDMCDRLGRYCYSIEIYNENESEE